MPLSPVVIEGVNCSKLSNRSFKKIPVADRSFKKMYLIKPLISTLSNSSRTFDTVLIIQLNEHIDLTFDGMT